MAAAATGGVTIVGGSVFAGMVVAGPVGAGIGALIGLAVAGAVGREVKAPRGLLTELWRGLLVRDEIIDQLPRVGLLRVDRGGAPAPPALEDAIMEKDVNSTLFHVVPLTVRGVDLATVRAGAPLSAQQREGINPFAMELLEEHNRARAQVGVARLQWSNRLARDAHAWAQHLAGDAEKCHRALEELGVLPDLGR